MADEVISESEARLLRMLLGGAVKPSVRYGASGAPKPAGPRLNSPPRPGQRPGAGRFFF